MTEEFSLKDYIKFFKKNINKILLTIGIVLGVYVIWATMNYMAADSPSDRETEEVEEVQFDQEMIDELLDTDFSVLTDQERAVLAEYLENDAYYFNFYIENGDFTPFTNNEVLKKILTTNNVLNQIEDISGERISPNPHMGVVISREYGDILSLRIGTGDEDVNREISQAYYDILINDEIDFLNNKDLYLMSNEPLSVDNATAEEEEINLSEESSASPSFMNSFGTDIVMGIIVIIGGLILGLLVAVLSRVFNKKISYLYDYNLNDDDKLVKFDGSHMDESNVKELNLLINKNSDHIILGENKDMLVEFESYIQRESGNQLNIATDVTNIDKPNDYNEYILLTKVDDTTKDWVKRQRILIRNMNKQMTFIQFS